MAGPWRGVGICGVGAGAGGDESWGVWSVRTSPYLDDVGLFGYDARDCVVSVHHFEGKVNFNDFPLSFFLILLSMRAFYLNVHLILQMTAFILNLIGFTVVFYTKVHFS